MSPKLNIESITQLPFHYKGNKFGNAKVSINPIDKAAAGSDLPDQLKRRVDVKQITPQLFFRKEALLVRHESKYFARNKVNVFKSAVGGMGPVHNPTQRLVDTNRRRSIDEPLLIPLSINVAKPEQAVTT